MVAAPARALMDPPTERLPRRRFSRATAPLRPPTKLLPSLLETASPHRPLPKRGEDLHGHHTRLHRHGCEHGGAPQPCAQGRIVCATRPWMHHRSSSLGRESRGGAEVVRDRCHPPIVEELRRVAEGAPTPNLVPRHPPPVGVCRGDGG
jgi:hypothetical protein